MSSFTTYVVTVKTFEDRHQFIRSQALANDLDIEFVCDYDVSDLISADLRRFAPHSLPLPSISCVLKHLEAQRRLVVSDSDYCLVVEDDAIFSSDFVSRLRLVIDMVGNLSGPWLVFLGGTDNKLDARFFESDNLQLIEAPLTTAEAYLINKQGCELRLEYLSDRSISLPADHLLAEIDRNIGISQYRVSHPFVGQGSISGKFGTSLDSSRGKKPLWFLKIRYLWNRFRNQMFARWIARSGSVLRLVINQYLR